MGGPSCWKQIIDNRNALVRQLDCMCETIRIAGATKPENLPTYVEAEEFQKAAEQLAKVAAQITDRVNG